MGEIASGAEGSASAWQTVFNLGNVAIGAGVLSFPQAFQLTGVLGGACLCVLVAGLGFCTLNVLVRQSVIHNAHTYENLVKAALGQGVADVMAFAIVMLCFGSCVAYFIIVGDSFKLDEAHLADYLSTFDSLSTCTQEHIVKLLATRQAPILAWGLLLALPLALQRSMVALVPASTVAVVVMTITTGIIAVRAAVAFASGKIELQYVHLFRFDAASIRAIPIMVFAYACHVPSVPLLFELTSNPALLDCTKMRRDVANRRDHSLRLKQELRYQAAVERSTRLLDHAHATESEAVTPLLTQHDTPFQHAPHRLAAVAVTVPSLQPRTREVSDSCAESLQERLKRKLPGMARVFVAAYTECTTLYLSAGIAGYLLFPQHVKADVLASFDENDELMHVMRVCVGLAFLLHYPINSHLSRTALYELFCRYGGLEPRAVVPYTHVLGVSLVFFAASIGTACSVKDLGLVFSVIGGVFSSMVVILLPGLLVVVYARNRRRKYSESYFLMSYPIEQLSRSVFEYEPLGWVIVLIGLFVLVITIYTTFA